MYTAAITLFTLVFLHLPSFVLAGPHDKIRSVRRRHHARARATVLERRESDCDEEDIVTTCTLGAWQCIGTELQRESFTFVSRQKLKRFRLLE